MDQEKSRKCKNKTILLKVKTYKEEGILIKGLGLVDEINRISK